MQRFRTFNLKDLLNQRKLIVFDFNKKENKTEYKILGKFLIIYLKLLVFKRDTESKNLVTCHLFIDEFHNFVTASIKEILQECRKYKLFLTLAQQQAGEDMERPLFKAIMGNVGIKLTGQNGDIETLEKMAKSTGESLETLQNSLATGRFSLWRKPLTGETAKPPIVINIPNNTVDDKQSMNNNDWERLKNEQIQRFYRSRVQIPQDEEKNAVQDEKTAPKAPIFNLDEYLH